MVLPKLISPHTAAMTAAVVFLVTILTALMTQPSNGSFWRGPSTVAESVTAPVCYALAQRGSAPNLKKSTVNVFYIWCNADIGSRILGSTTEVESDAVMQGNHLLPGAMGRPKLA